MPEPLLLRTTLQARGPAAAVVLTDEQLERLAGGAKTPPVRVTVNGGETFAGRVGRMRGETLIGFNKAIREQCGVHAGDEIEVRVELDEGPRPVELPPELEAALFADPAKRDAFEALAPSRRKELARGIADAQKPETRERRLAAALASLAA